MGKDLVQNLFHHTPVQPASTYPITPAVQAPPVLLSLSAATYQSPEQNQQIALSTINASDLGNIIQPQLPGNKMQIVQIPDNTNYLQMVQSTPQGALYLSDDELVKIIQKREKENETLIVLLQQKEITTSMNNSTNTLVSTSTMSKQVELHKKSSPKVPPMFYGCKFNGPVTFNFTK